MIGLGGLSGMNPAKMEKMLKKLNIDMRQLPATEVIIKGETHDIVITEPDISIVKMQGRDVFQITGNIEEKAKSGSEKAKPEAVNKEDVKMIMEQTGKDKESVEAALKKVNNDLAKAIMELKKE
ncbi:nascent polypeptide-associated complex protein [archaeon]|nr:nascent polypeptide-associated complex protein [archaeon]|tara:strand:- start:745 stop:1116 length:372 start_codon:yes stop_codon:yes gene_type:complete